MCAGTLPKHCESNVMPEFGRAQSLEAVHETPQESVIVFKLPPCYDFEGLTDQSY